MNGHQRKVREFMLAAGQAVPDGWAPERFPHELRARLVEEEARELAGAIRAAAVTADWVPVVDGIADLLYVTYGAAVALGVDVEPFFAEVHRSNMSKVGPDGRVEYRDDGKVLKPPTYSPPSLGAVLKAAAHSRGKGG